MNKRLSISILSFISTFIFSGCCSIYLQLENKDRYNIDVYDHSDAKNYTLDFGLGGSEDLYHYTNDSLDKRFKYEFKIVSPKLPLVRLNSVIFTQDKDRDTVSVKLYFISDNKAHAIPIDSLPFLNTDTLQGYPDVFRIIAESSESYHRTKKIYISFDIEVGKERIVRKNIEYRRRWEVDCRPKF